MKQGLPHSKIALLTIGILSLGVSSFVFEEAFADITSAPVLTATSSGLSTIDLSWTPSTFNGLGGDTGVEYDVERSLTGAFGGEETIISAAQVPTTYQDTGLDSGTEYFYRIVPRGDVTGRNVGFASNIDSATTSSISTDSCKRDCVPPTMGYDTDGTLIVEDGFSYNGHSVNVAAWHTEYPLIVVQTGKMNVLQAKIYDDWGVDNINSVRIAFGVPEIGKLFQGETIIEYHPNEIIGSQINVIDKNNLLDKVSITTEKTNCNSSDNSPTCTLLTMEHMFREAPLSNVVGISLSDKTRNPVQFYFNDGIGVDGESLNPPQTAIQTLNQKGTPQIQLIQIDRAENLWLDEQNNLWFKNSFGTWIKITPDEGVKANSESIAKNGINRTHPIFKTYKSGQELLATQIWNSANIQSVLPDSTTIEFDGIYRMDDPQLQKTMLEQIKKAEQIYAQKYDKKIHP